ncbi:MAG: hypothetical protein H6753_02795 [Candidatus Omnitrophica bacterium]|nr:hypothetical protein [Candidatus Omnitrophota bacterium]
MVASSLIAFIWAFCEATFFFIVPDVWLTWLVISKSDYKELSRAVFCATLGAIVGGIVVYQAGRFLSYSIVSGWLDQVPGISRELIASLAMQVDQNGVYSYLKGMWAGNPYKIYAFLWGAKAGNLWPWLGVSIGARAIRFIFAVLGAVVINKLGEKFIARWALRKTMIFIIAWGCFYIFYFFHFAKIGY